MLDWNVTCSHDYETLSMQLILVIILQGPQHFKKKLSDVHISVG